MSDPTYCVYSIQWSVGLHSLWNQECIYGSVVLLRYTVLICPWRGCDAIPKLMLYWLSLCIYKLYRYSSLLSFSLYLSLSLSLYLDIALSSYRPCPISLSLNISISIFASQHWLLLKRAKMEHISLVYTAGSCECVRVRACVCVCAAVHNVQDVLSAM